MGQTVLIETPFASATQTAKILGVSKFRTQQLVKMLELKKQSSKGRFVSPTRVSSKKQKSAKGTGWVTLKSVEKSGTGNFKRRLSGKKHASKKTRSSNSGNSSR
jgi:hypothetical protein